MENTDHMCIRKLGHKSLYTWMRQNISARIAQRRNSLVSISLLREDGFSLSYELHNESFNHVQNDPVFHRRCVLKVEEIISAIKQSRMHERSLLIFRRVGYDATNYPFDETEVYLIIRFADREYIHATYGPKIKQLIAVDQLNNTYLQDYINHFTLSGKVFDIVKNKTLGSIISLNAIDYTKLNQLKETLGPNHPSVISIEKSLFELNHLLIFYKALKEEEYNNLKELSFVGLPNYQITLDNRMKIYLKSSSAESFGNGNALFFYLDTIS